MIAELTEEDMHYKANVPWQHTFLAPIFNIYVQALIHELQK